MRKRSIRWVTALLALLVAGGCDPYPRDPEGTFERAAGGVLRVGATEAPPWIERTDTGATGPEAELVDAFAAAIDARVEWHWGGVDDHLTALEHHELDVVVGGLRAKSPWSKRVGMTRPWHKAGDTMRVLAVGPGENRTLVALDRIIEARKRGR